VVLTLTLMKEIITKLKKTNLMGKITTGLINLELVVEAAKDVAITTKVETTIEMVTETIEVAEVREEIVDKAANKVMKIQRSRRMIRDRSSQQEHQDKMMLRNYLKVKTILMTSRTTARIKKRRKCSLKLIRSKKNGLQ
jgi:hypothetical protein